LDFFGFHPLYVVILVALALIIFGPSRLPKMGAQMGRMLREFQVAREGLTQQMRDAFEEEPDSDAGPTVADEEAETEPEASTGTTVAVIDPPAWHSTLEDPEPAADVTAETAAAVEAANAYEEPKVAGEPETSIEGAAAGAPETALEPQAAEAHQPQEPEATPTQAEVHADAPEAAATPEPATAPAEAAATATAAEQPDTGTAPNTTFASVAASETPPEPGTDEVHQD